MYAYFYLGFEKKISEINSKLIGDNSIYQAFTYEEAIKIPPSDVIKAVQVICGYSNTEDILNYSPIRLSEFISCEGYIPPEANLVDKQNRKIFLNGNHAIEDEDYKIDLVNHKLLILWDVIKDTDTFSFSIPIRFSKGSN